MLDLSDENDLIDLVNTERRTRTEQQPPDYEETMNSTHINIQEYINSIQNNIEYNIENNQNQNQSHNQNSIIDNTYEDHFNLNDVTNNQNNNDNNQNNNDNNQNNNNNDNIDDNDDQDYSSTDTLLPDYEPIDNNDELINHIYFDTQTNSLRISLIRIEHNIRNINLFGKYLLSTNLVLFIFGLLNNYFTNFDNYFNNTDINTKQNKIIIDEYNDYNDKLLICFILSTIGFMLQTINYRNLDLSIFSLDNRKKFYNKKNI